ncbi:hydroxymethylbilane synthase [candidate division KSB3 bacterium]|uniref:Porphobilinogen deaminase n=1 Tax=candidate division KSB3 bacterium TaxID=2044937 RepID=A0A2G6KH90_9BACT|nr:MAG: hydroxymethylbilane synthase [candidate division KSB3 bacterium]
MSILKIATRKSQLAQIQADQIIESLKVRFGRDSEKLLVSTKGDQILHVTLDKIGSKGLFVKEIETALFEGDADAAVHSMKDLPHQLPEGCELAAILSREDVRDAFIAKDGFRLMDLPSGAKIGTSSRRRAQQLQQLRPDIEVLPIRGNVQTRIKKLETENLDGTILAVAGLKRLGLESVITEYFDLDQMVPAVGQGALGVEILSQHEHADLFRRLNEPETRMCVDAERSFIRRLDADCHAAVGAYARIKDGTMYIIGIFEVNGQLVKKDIVGDPNDSLNLGKQLANAILSGKN